jgi:hypothetical protein
MAAGDLLLCTYGRCAPACFSGRGRPLNLIVRRHCLGDNGKASGIYAMRWRMSERYLAMSTRPQVGLPIARASIAFSALSFLLYFVFTPVAILAVLFGAIGVVFAIASKAKRTALVAATFGLVPIAQLLIEQSTTYEYLVFVPAVMAFVVSGVVLANYSKARGAALRPTT